MNRLSEFISFFGKKELIRMIDDSTPGTYAEFLEEFYEDLDFVIGLLEADAKDTMSWGEDEVNRALVRLLRARHHRASHDHDEGGHVDIRVESRDSKFSWLGEAKLDNGPKYIESGLDQLVDRYSRGTPNHNAGGLLIYTQKADCAGMMKNWSTELKSKQLNGFELEECKLRPKLAFYSSFVIPRIGPQGEKYKVRHIGISLFRTG
jgi:hypothetical protein